MSILEKKLDKSVKDYYYYKATGKFDVSQLDLIKCGFDNGLSKEKVEVYANLVYTIHQMYEILWGFQVGLSIEQVKVYANPKFNSDQMAQIRAGFEDGLTMEQVKSYANPYLPYTIMRKKRLNDFTECQ